MSEGGGGCIWHLVPVIRVPICGLKAGEDREDAGGRSGFGHRPVPGLNSKSSRIAILLKKLEKLSIIFLHHIEFLRIE